jgi:CRISPR system Cascade subunit CasE
MTMYLTRAYLNPRRRGAIRLLGHPQRMHAAVLAGFPPLPADARVLWRLDSDEPHRPVLWIVSPYRPDLAHLAEQAGWPGSDAPQWESRSYEPLLKQLDAGQQYAFRLTANPTRAIAPDGTGRRGKRVEHVTAARQAAWLLARAENAGFRVAESGTCMPGTDDPALQLQLADRAKVRFTKNGHDGTITIARVTYEGMLEVTGPDALRHALTFGIGRARAYGCGLLTLAKPQAAIR